jgi:hypothetical protein
VIKRNSETSDSSEAWLRPIDDGGIIQNSVNFLVHFIHMADDIAFNFNAQKGTLGGGLHKGSTKEVSSFVCVSYMIRTVQPMTLAIPIPLPILIWSQSLESLSWPKGLAQ